MAAAAQHEAVIAVADRPPSPKRPSRARKPSTKVREAMQSLEDTAPMSRRTVIYAMRSTASRGTVCERRAMRRRGTRALQALLNSANRKMGRKGRKAGRALAMERSNARANGARASRQARGTRLPCTATPLPYLQVLSLLPCRSTTAQRIKHFYHLSISIHCFDGE
ncbi:hypothetical protein N657DRAFT_245772 [Parathielavia appendiculata]|uniref:Uncharacterized protein n=1 Tax=Parathielavia appendiculata TaxID=2587402 RepID=A0AAN6Z0S6_9PEZI|nr:hypothetical protein N657DRAFT_245772 [Parathielavia appendiculata]